MIAANPPYLSEADLAAAPPELAFEPAEALVAGPTGLEAIARIAAEAPEHLEPGGWVLIEVGQGQARGRGGAARGRAGRGGPAARLGGRRPGGRPRRSGRGGRAGRLRQGSGEPVHRYLAGPASLQSRQPAASPGEH